jgi:hypothetical protein
MAQIDASIPLGIRPMQVENPMNQLAQVLQIQGIKQQQEARNLALQKENRLAQVLGQSYAKPEEREEALLRGGFIDQSTKLAKDRRDNMKTDADTKKTSYETVAKKLEIMGQTFGAVRANPTLESAMMALDYLGQNGAMEPQEVAQYKTQIQANPGQIAALADQAFRATLDAKDQIAKYQTNNTGGQTVTQAIDPVTGKATQVSAIRNTQSPDNAASVAVQMRGQNMTDSRAREFNAIKQDENNIKRSEKKDVQDLTKNSQIASMDTMLGTLDRLSAHPGLSRSVGIKGAFPTMPGSQSANFQAELNTFQSQAFIPMVAQLKGMGALSDAEGKKLTAAVGALDPKMGEEAFRESVSRIIEDMESARQRLAGARRTEKKNATPGGVSGKVVDFGSLK